MPAINLLTDTAIRAAMKQAAASGKAVKKSDGGGLVLLAQPDGVRGWWRLRTYSDGREGMLSLGVYPDVTLKAARAQRDAKREQAAAGVDLSAARKAERQERAGKREAAQLIAEGKPLPGTFEHVAREWLETKHEPETVAKHSGKTRARLEQYVFPVLGREPIGNIEAPALLAILRRLAESGRLETAHRVRGACSQIFRYALASGLCSRNPAADLLSILPAASKRHHAAITTPQDAGVLMRAIDAYHGHPVTTAALKMSALLFLRPGELRQIEWAWIDTEVAMLTVPAAAMKRDRKGKDGPPHLVPLARQALDVLKTLRALTGAGRYVFTAYGTARPMSENTVNTALRRMGFDADTHTAHGFRAMARTLAAERLGVQPEVIEAQLDHAVPDALGRAYNRTQYLEQRRDLMQRWADYLESLREGAKVIPLRGGSA